MKVKVKGKWFKVVGITAVADDIGPLMCCMKDVEKIRIDDEAWETEDADEKEELSKKIAQETGKRIIQIAKKYGVNELDLLKAVEEVNQLPDCHRVDDDCKCVKCGSDLVEQEAEVGGFSVISGEVCIWLSFCDNKNCERYKIVVI